MPDIRPTGPLWRSEIARNNATYVQVKHRKLLEAFECLDMFGHRMLERISNGKIENNEQWLAVVLLRRHLLHFVAVRHLIADACVDGAKLSARALFETCLASRYAIYGGARPISRSTPTTSRAREIRARYYRVQAMRAEIYQKQSLLEGRFGLRVPARTARRRIRRENNEMLKYLESQFPTQHARFGPMSGSHDRKKWYSFGFRRAKVNSVRALAKRLGRLDEYNFCYVPFSGLTHPFGLGHDTSIEGELLGIISPYNTGSISAVGFWSLRWQLRGLGYLMNAHQIESRQDLINTWNKVAELTDSLEADVPEEYFGEEPRVALRS